MATATDVIVVPDGGGTAGAVVWWELSGFVDFADLTDVLDSAGTVCPRPYAPGLEVAASRATQEQVKTKRQLVRPLKRRGQWDFVTEDVSLDVDTGKPKLFHTPIARVTVEQASVSYEALQPQGDAVIDAIKSRVGFYENTLAVADVSEWLLRCAGSLHALGLRERGGFYFMPADSLETWHQIRDALKAVSTHRMREMPAMRTEEAVAEILFSLRTDASRQMDAFEEYLKGTTSTKGLNAAARDLEVVQRKIKHYADLLGVALPDLLDRHDTLVGAVTAARLAGKEEP